MFKWTFEVRRLKQMGCNVQVTLCFQWCALRVNVNCQLNSFPHHPWGRVLGAFFLRDFPRRPNSRSYKDNYKDSFPIIRTVLSLRRDRVRLWLVHDHRQWGLKCPLRRRVVPGHLFACCNRKDLHHRWHYRHMKLLVKLARSHRSHPHSVCRLLCTSDRLCDNRRLLGMVLRIGMIWALKALLEQGLL